jgi:hypothetical protein
MPCTHGFRGLPHSGILVRAGHPLENSLSAPIFESKTVAMEPVNAYDIRTDPT